jgi:hypothetical protein
MPSDKKQGFVEYSHGRPQSCPSTGCMEVMENGIGQMPLGVMLQGESERQEVLVKPAEAVAVPGLEHNWSTTSAGVLPRLWIHPASCRLAATAETTERI